MPNPKAYTCSLWWKAYRATDRGPRGHSPPLHFIKGRISETIESCTLNHIYSCYLGYESSNDTDWRSPGVTPHSFLFIMTFNHRNFSDPHPKPYIVPNHKMHPRDALGYAYAPPPPLLPASIEAFSDSIYMLVHCDKKHQVTEVSVFLGPDLTIGPWTGPSDYQLDRMGCIPRTNSS